MRIGHWIYAGDRTTCGGVVLEGNTASHHSGIGFKRQATYGCNVTCGIHGGVYTITGNNTNYPIGGSFLANTLNSFSTCPCHARFIPSEMMNAPIGECTQSDNRLANGVFVWTEKVDAGHSYVSIHKNNRVHVFTYGRFGLTGVGGFAGDGILVYLQDEYARSYFRHELYKMGARVFAINDADIDKTIQYYTSSWNKGSTPIFPEKTGEATRQFGVKIDTYDITSSNCATHTVESIIAGGSKVFDRKISILDAVLDPKEIIFYEPQEKFIIPSSLEDFLVGKKHDLSSMVVMEVTEIFKQQYPNIDNVASSGSGVKRMVMEQLMSISGASREISGIPFERSGGSIGEIYE